MEYDVSIIVPIYRSALTLRRCLDSVLAQDYQGLIEVILSADDSGDGSLEICRQYCINHPDIFVLYEPAVRRGMGEKRMEAYLQAKGNYIYSLDSDDELPPDCISTLVKAIQRSGADMVNASFFTTKESKVNAKRDPFHPLRPKLLSREKAIKAFLNDATFRGFLWTKLFKRELLYRRPFLCMKGDKAMFEDAAIVASLLVHCKTVYHIPNPVYYYYKDNPNSEVTKPRNDRTLRHLAVFSAIRLLFEAMGLEDSVAAFRHKAYRTKMSFSYDISRDKKGGIGKEDLAKVRGAIQRLFRKESPRLENEPYGAFLEGCLLKEK